MTNELPAIIFAKEDQQQFSRCTFPILGRPVIHYPLLAAQHSLYVSKTYVTTPNDSIKHKLNSFSGFEYIERKNDHASLLETIHQTVQHIQNHEKESNYVVILLGNSPCILNKHIDSAFEILLNNPDKNAIVSASKRREFSAEHAYKIEEDGTLSLEDSDQLKGHDVFIDARFFIVKTELILNIDFEETKNLYELFKQNSLPLIQEEGISDIDYAWQIPLVERWLLHHEFNHNNSPYEDIKSSVVEDKSSSVSPSSNKKLKVFISTVPFGEINTKPIQLLKQQSKLCDFVINPIGRKLKPEEVPEMIKDVDIVIAGTENLSLNTLKQAKNLKMISRVGIGLDNVALNYAKENGIKVSYTPDSPSAAVAELALGHMLNCVRFTSMTDRKLREGVWHRSMGQRLNNLTIGIIGTGRIGSKVLRHLQGFGPPRLLVNDLNPNHDLYTVCHAEHVDIETIYKECDIISVHIPLQKKYFPLITKKEISLMKESVYLINTARGGIIKEDDLYEALKSKRICGAAIDVFDEEPYNGPLVELDNCIMSCHMGSCTVDCRYEMELKATEEAIRFMNKQELISEVPDYEYENSDE